MPLTSPPDAGARCDGCGGVPEHRIGAIHLCAACMAKAEAADRASTKRRSRRDEENNDITTMLTGRRRPKEG